MISKNLNDFILCSLFYRYKRIYIKANRISEKKWNQTGMEE